MVAVADAQEHAEETFNSLQFGSRAMCVQTQVRLRLTLNLSPSPFHDPV